MNQRVIIAKVAGQAANDIEGLFHQWSAARTPDPDEPTLFESGQWPEACHHQMTTLLDLLRENATQPPIVFFQEYVDMWSMGDVFSSAATPEHGNGLIEVMSDEADMACYALPDSGSLLDHLRRCMRRKRVRERTPQEDRWIIEGLLNACLAWEPLIDKSVLVIARLVVGGLVEDEEILASSTSTPDWLKSLTITQRK